VNEFYKWFEEVLEISKMWWVLSLVVCAVDALCAYIKFGTLAAAVVSFSQSALLLFILGPLIMGTLVYMIKQRG